jgi:hypothetical protein
VGLGAAALGASRAPLLPLVWGVLVRTLPPPAQPTYRVVLTWMVQPTHVTSATVAALTLGATGTLAYAIFGPAGETLAV